MLPVIFFALKVKKSSNFICGVIEAVKLANELTIEFTNVSTSYLVKKQEAKCRICLKIVRFKNVLRVLSLQNKICFFWQNFKNKVRGHYKRCGEHVLIETMLLHLFYWAVVVKVL